MRVKIPEQLGEAGPQLVGLGRDSALVLPDGVDACTRAVVLLERGDHLIERLERACLAGHGVEVDLKRRRCPPCGRDGVLLLGRVADNLPEQPVGIGNCGAVIGNRAHACCHDITLRGNAGPEHRQGWRDGVRLAAKIRLLGRHLEEGQRLPQCRGRGRRADVRQDLGAVIECGTVAGALGRVVDVQFLRQRGHDRLRLDAQLGLAALDAQRQGVIDVIRHLRGIARRPVRPVATAKLSEAPAEAQCAHRFVRVSWYRHDPPTQERTTRE